MKKGQNLVSGNDIFCCIIPISEEETPGPQQIVGQKDPDPARTDQASRGWTIRLPRSPSLIRPLAHSEELLGERERDVSFQLELGIAAAAD